MAVDRGGLTYNVKLVDQFSTTAKNFRKQLAASKAAFADFQKGATAQRDSAASFRKTTKAVDENAAALKRLAAESKRQRAVEREAFAINRAAQRDAAQEATRRVASERAVTKQRAEALRAEQKQIRDSIAAKNRSQNEAAKLEAARRKDEARNLADQQKALKGFAQAQLARERESAKISAAQRKDEAKVRDIDPQFQAQKRLNDALREEAIARQQIGLLRQRSVQQFKSGDILGGAKSLQQAKDLEKTLAETNATGNRLFFTFRRLVGVLALFTIARNVVQGFQDLVKAGIEFNDKVEAATTSIAGILVAVTDVRNKFGQSVKPAEELGAALGAAQDQVKRLRQEAFQTTATFEQLLDTFQIAIAPGFGAGLKLDEIRKFSVQISQAASALGLAQNQLSEEIRSILSGTIQARTTRIATALGITNADIRRVKETGKLFDFLQDRFQGFAEAAQRQARSTLTGLSTLVRGALQSVLGEAAKPLFDELIGLGNALLDSVLRIKDAEGNLVPNPEIVAGFREIFDVLLEGVETVRDVIKDLGFGGFQATLKAAGAALGAGIQFALGFAQQFLTVILGIVKAVGAIGRVLGISAKGFGKIAGLIGSIVALTVLWNTTIGLTGLKVNTIFGLFNRLPPVVQNIVGRMGQWVGVLGVVLVGYQLLQNKILDINLDLADTIKFTGKALVNAAQNLFTQFEALGALITNADAAKKQQILDDFLKRNEEFDKEFAEAVNRNAEPVLNPAAQLDQQLKGLKGFEGVISGVDRATQALDATIQKLRDDIFKTNIEFSAAFRSEDLTGSAAKIQDVFSEAFTEAKVQARQLNQALEAVALSIDQIQKKNKISPERFALVKGVADLPKEQAEAAGELFKLTEAEGQIVSFLRDQQSLKEALLDLDRTANELAQRKAALIAVSEARSIARELEQTRQQLTVQQAITQAEAQRLDQRKRAILDAQNAINDEKVASDRRLKDLQAEIDFLNKKLEINATALPGQETLTPAQVAADRALIAAKQEQLDLDKAMTAERLKQLGIAEAEAQLVASGTIAQGLQRGFENFVKDIPTAFEFGVELVKQSTTQLADFISTSIVQAFDPNQKGTDLRERFGRFLQSIAQLIFQQLAQLAIAAALQKILGETQASAIEVGSATTASAIRVTGATTAASIEISAATTAAAIRSASGGFFHSGGLVPQGFAAGGLIGKGKRAATKAHAIAEGYASGGPLRRPKHIHPLDTVPAWLQPGEFVMRKSAVDKFGLDFFRRVNSGGLSIPAALPTGAHAANAVGMARGGPVSGQAAHAQITGSGAEREIIPLPVFVAKEKEADRIFTGGKNALMRAIQDNAGSIKGILGVK